MVSNSSKNRKEVKGTVSAAASYDLDECFAIEELVREWHPDAASQGFLLSSGDARSAYGDFLSPGTFFVHRSGSQINGFIFCLAPDSERIRILKSAKSKYELIDPSVWEKPNLAWLAKVAVRPDLMGQGIADSLYSTLLGYHKDWHFLTTTVKAPIRNIPSEHLQKKYGFKPIGSLNLGDRGTLKGIICTVYFRGAIAAA